MKTAKQMSNFIMKQNPRSKRAKGVKSYALELITNVITNYEDRERDIVELRKALLNGAKDRKEYSRGGCSEIYNRDIAKRLCTDSELKKTKNGQRRPNKNEARLDTQARALYQAEQLIAQAYRD